MQSKLAQLEVGEAAPEPALQPEPELAEAQAAEKREVADRKVVAKFLVSNAAAGSIIGKAGASISELQSQSGARLQLSRANEFFPGTTDRVVLASGTVNQVLTALHLVLTRDPGRAGVLPGCARSPARSWVRGGKCRQGMRAWGPNTIEPLTHSGLLAWKVQLWAACPVCRGLRTC